MPSSSCGVDDPFSYCQDKIISHKVSEYVDNPVIVQQGIERVGVIVEEGNHVLPFIARLGFRSPASRQFHGGVEGVGYHARSALGFATLPTGAAVEVEAIFEVKD